MHTSEIGRVLVRIEAQAVCTGNTPLRHCHLRDRERDDTDVWAGRSMCIAATANFKTCREDVR